MTREQEESFDCIWYTLSNQGYCDGLGGAEYRRVLASWEKAGFPDDVDVFIMSHANQRYLSGLLTEQYWRLAHRLP